MALAVSGGEKEGCVLADLLVETILLTTLALHKMPQAAWRVILCELPLRCAWSLLQVL